MTTILGLNLMQNRGDADQVLASLAEQFANAGLSTLVINFGPTQPVTIQPLQRVVPFADAMLSRFHPLDGMITETNVPNLDYAELGMPVSVIEQSMTAEAEAFLAGHLLLLDYDYVIMMGEWRPGSPVLQAQLNCTDFVLPVVVCGEDRVSYSVADLPIERVPTVLVIGNKKCREVTPRGVTVIKTVKMSPKIATQILGKLMASRPAF